MSKKFANKSKFTNAPKRKLKATGIIKNTTHTIRIGIIVSKTVLFTFDKHKYKLQFYFLKTIKFCLNIDKFSISNSLIFTRENYDQNEEKITKSFRMKTLSKCHQVYNNLKACLL